MPDVPGADREALLETFSFALALAPDERYPTALAFAAPLKRALGDALTRPAAPRKRRTPRPAGALLPIDDPEPDTFPARSAPVMPIVDGASPPPRYDDAADFGLRPSDPADHAAPSYLSGPTEPEPSAPAIEPIAAPGDVYPMTPAGHAGRDAAVDDEETVSSGDAVQLSGSEEPFDRWDMPGEARADGVSRLVDGDIGRPDAGRYGVDDALDYSLGDNPNYAPDRHAPYEPPAGNFAAGDYAAALDEDTTAPRAPWLAFAALLLAGIVAGLAGGWFLFSGRGERSASAVGTAQSESGNTPSRNTGAGSTASDGTEPAARPREWTDDAVRQSAGMPKSGAAAPAAGPTSSMSPESRTAPAPPAETASRGRLVVRTRPAGARVEIGGRSRGESPATVTDLAYGQHTVRVSRSGYATEQRRVTLSARRPAVTVDVTLRRDAARAASAPAPSGRPPEGGFVGSLVIESRPAGAKVFLDGRGVGVTPVTLSEVGVGSHVVRLDMTGYRRWSTSIRVVAGERERVAASLEEEAPR